MTTVETVGRIRRAYFVQKLSVREIARRLHVSRKTVRKAIEAEEGAFSYERAVQPMPRLGAHVAELERLLAENERKPRREKLTLAQGVTSADVVLNILARSRSAPVEPSIAAPEHLRLSIEPSADAGRYDRLLPIRQAA